MAKFDKALLIYNGNAGSGNIEQQLAQTLPVLSQSIKEMTVVQTASIEDSNNVCAAFAEKVDLLIILGGDGTIHECINSIAPLPKRPIVAILPGGTSNDFSRTLNMPQNLKQAAHAIVQGDITEIDAGKSGDRYFLNFWGIGLVADTAMKHSEEEKNSLGVLSYFMNTLRTITDAKSFHYKISTDERSYQGEAVMILLLNGRFLGTQEMPISSFHPSDGKIDGLIIKDSTLATFRQLLSFKNQTFNEGDLEQFEYFQSGTVNVTTDEVKNIDMDGEINETTPSEINVLPKHFRMIQGG